MCAVGFCFLFFSLALFFFSCGTVESTGTARPLLNKRPESARNERRSGNATLCSPFESRRSCADTKRNRHFKASHLGSSVRREWPIKRAETTSRHHSKFRAQTRKAIPGRRHYSILTEKKTKYENENATLHVVDHSNPD